MAGLFIGFLVEECVACQYSVIRFRMASFSFFTEVDCKTVRIFAYSSTREQSNKRSGTRLKTESETGERR